MLRLFVLLPYAVLAALFLAGLFARYVRPRRWWGLQYAAVGLPFSALALAAFTPAILPLAPAALAGTHLGLLTLAAVRFVPWRRLGQRRRPSAPALTVMTFNAHTRRRTPERHPFFDLLRRERPDLIALQEPALANLLPLARIYPATDPPFFSEPMRRHYDLPLSFDWLLPNPIVTRLDVLELTRRPFGEGGSVTRARVRWDGRDFVVYDVHLRSYTFARPWRGRGRKGPVAWREQLRRLRDDVRLRAEQADHLRALLDAETLPFLVCGDLNTTPHEWTYRRLATGLRDAFTHAGRGRGATYHARHPLFRIDYVFASPEWRIHTAHVPAFILSDHRPVVVRLSL